MNSENAIKSLRVGKLKVEIHPDGRSAGEAAARAVAQTIKEAASPGAQLSVVFAAAASQLHTLRALIATEGMPWQQVVGFHLDEYVGIDADHPASFRRFLRENLTQYVQMKEFFEMDGNASNSTDVCQEYARKLQSAEPRLALLGIGENGHLAFNDPHEANFSDPLDVKVVHLDEACRQQQVAEAWFSTLEKVPKLAITITIPAVLRVPKLIASVPGIRKANIMRTTLEAPITSACPATILRTHPDATIYLDRDSASELRSEI